MAAVVIPTLLPCQSRRNRTVTQQMRLWLMDLQSHQRIHHLSPEQVRNTHPTSNSLGAITS
ncbi:MAG TPA: hypothetical protein V6D19_16250 [Stenomitos sp.]